MSRTDAMKFDSFSMAKLLLEIESESEPELLGGALEVSELDSYSIYLFLLSLSAFFSFISEGVDFPSEWMSP